jgi:hypothetical protein
MLPCCRWDVFFFLCLLWALEDEDSDESEEEPVVGESSELTSLLLDWSDDEGGVLVLLRDGDLGV